MDAIWRYFKVLNEYFTVKLLRMGCCLPRSPPTNYKLAEFIEFLGLHCYEFKGCWVPNFAQLFKGQLNNTIRARIRASQDQAICDRFLQLVLFQLV